MKIKIIDLHADILSYLAKHPYNSAYDTTCRTAIPQLTEGGVILQVMPIYTAKQPTGLKQARLYKALELRYPSVFGLYGRIKTRLAIENGSSFFKEDEPFDKGIMRLESIERPLYMSLTWNGENRFGGGNLTKVGLKDDGRRLLDTLVTFCDAIDLSHTSDKLAEGILHYMSKKGLPLKLLASHSNFRKVYNHPRNLPDDIASQIVKQGGLIGMNFIRPFLGESKESFYDHVAYGLKCGYEKSLALGADLFATSLLPKGTNYFFDGLDNASCYPYVHKELTRRFGAKIANAICHDNASRFINT